MIPHVAASEPITGHTYRHMIFVAEHAATCRVTSSNFVPIQCPVRRDNRARNTLRLGEAHQATLSRYSVLQHLCPSAYRP
jgi:hypothetical protein